MKPIIETQSAAVAPFESRFNLQRIARGLFGSIPQSIGTIVSGSILVLVIYQVLRWAWWDATLSLDAEACAINAGACWSPIIANFELYMVGPYPFDQRWRALTGLVILIALVIGFCFRRLRDQFLFRLGAPILMAAVLALSMGGDWMGLPFVGTNQWGGLFVTLLLAINGIALAFPLAILLALGRLSQRMPVVRMLCTGIINGIRGVPLISILFLASFMLPLFMPEGMTVDNLVRALIGIVFYQAAFLAEVVRAGILSIPRGQSEAGMALGLRDSRIMLSVTLPQALRVSIPAIVNEFIATVKETSLVAIIGIFDLLGVANLILANPQWAARPIESFTFVAAIYWTICFSISQVSRALERQLAKAG